VAFSAQSASPCTLHPACWSFGGPGVFSTSRALTSLAERRADMITSGGANVFPAEVDAVLTIHPAVEGCVAIEPADGDLDQRVHAVLEMRDALDENELRAYMASRIVRYKIPRSFGW
jgi:acyl-CoA synthetase (AMP-forming)/AMP-acid ligase II